MHWCCMLSIYEYIIYFDVQQISVEVTIGKSPHRELPDLSRIFMHGYNVSGSNLHIAYTYW